MHVKTQLAREKLLSLISGNGYREGMKLPSERELCEQFNVGRGAIRAILSDLEQSGMLGSQPGRYGKTVIDTRRRREWRFALINCVPHHCPDESNFANGNSQEKMYLIDAVSREAVAQGGEVTLLFLTEEELSDRLFPLWHSGECHGVILTERIPDNVLAWLTTEKMPFVVANLEFSQNCPATKVDWRAVGRMMAGELIAAGHTNLGMLMFPSTLYAEILAGARGRLAEDNLFFNQEAVISIGSADGDEKEEQVMEALDRLYRNANSPTAFLAGRDHRAQVLYNFCREKKLCIPDDISVIGYDNCSWNQGAYFGLTTIAQPVVKIGRSAVQMLAQWIQYGIVPAFEPVLLPGTIIRRTSIRQL